MLVDAFEPLNRRLILLWLKPLVAVYIQREEPKVL